MLVYDSKAINRLFDCMSDMTGGVNQGECWYEWCIAKPIDVRKQAVNLQQNEPCFCMLTGY